MNNKNYRWGILGAGRIAEKFCTALAVVKGSEVYAVASRNEDRAKEYAAKFNASKWYTNYDDLLKDKEVDIVYIATPHSFHHQQAIACLQNGKAVLCEKPMSLSYRQTKEMIDTATERKLFLMEGMWTACMPSIKKIQSLIEEDVIGAPQFLSADFGFAAPLDLESRLYNKSLGGGSIMDVGIYPIALATLLFGEPTVIKTIARLAATGVDEYANIICQFSNGASAQLISSICFQTAIEAEIVGTKGRIKINNPWFKATDFSVILEDGTDQAYSFPHLGNGFGHEIMEVMHCLDNGLLQSTKVTHQLTLSVSRIMETVLEQAGVEY
ncbi:MAG: gfo/Idh/MocA family oxidoreductase [Ferruginibacter sp.]|nr:gfo/Idh/MocA family oxidoreductase [Ferruginibacter sp.]